VAAIVAAAAGAWQQHDKNRKSKAANRRQQEFANRMAGRNTSFEDAISGRYGGGGTGFQRDMYKIAQGQDLSPWLLNQPLNQINRSADTNMASLTAQLGRSNMSGGLANAYALSNQMGRQNSTANLFQNYGQFREQQRRSDLDWLTGGQGRQLDRDIGVQQGSLDRFQESGNPALAGAMAGIGTYAGSGGTWGQQPRSQSTIQTSNPQQQYINSFGSQGSWYNPANSSGGWNSGQQKPSWFKYK
jgi:hypothetical protein